jgi:cytochrome c oxidase assembly protein subunit 15
VGATAASAAAPFSHALVTSPAAQRAVGVWLFGGAAWVFSMVVLGGVTRLTRSGLSMTDWRFTGEAAPRTPADWDAEFAKYRASPEYMKVNRGMGLEEFKSIYWMEYAHRMWCVATPPSSVVWARDSCCCLCCLVRSSSFS